MNELRLSIPLIPPSGNHYKTYRIVAPKGYGKPFVRWYLTKEAEAWQAAVAIVNGGRKIRGASLEINFVVFLPDRRMCDVDNFSKCIFDALTACGCIEDDKFVDDFHGHRRYDPLNPRTIIVVRSPQDALFKDGRV